MFCRHGSKCKCLVVYMPVQVFCVVGAGVGILFCRCGCQCRCFIGDDVIVAVL